MNKIANDENLLSSFESFFTTFNKLTTANEEPEKIEKLSLNIAEVQTFFTSFIPLYDTHFKNGGDINVWKIAGLKHDEVRNCSVLAWFLNPKASHGQGYIFFKALLSCLGSSPITFEDMQSGYNVTVEQSSEIYDEDEIITSKSKNRVDIVVENSKIILFIEAKIDASEGDKQLDRYAKQLSRTCGRRKASLIYLTKSGILSDEREFGVDVRPLSWARIAKAFEQTLKENVDTKEYNTFNRPLWASITQQFCEHIKQF